ncbi:hypothetical protein DL98DRAFT_288679 [Cadophora sp. DSE1049]|nr:hypothetical protein DL98DRAFT_288679 [Cadophora sp. DSE1049]
MTCRLQVTTNRCKSPGTTTSSPPLKIKRLDNRPSTIRLKKLSASTRIFCSRRFKFIFSFHLSLPVKEKELHFLCYSKALFSPGRLYFLDHFPISCPILWDRTKTVNLAAPQEHQELEIILFSEVFRQETPLYPLWMGSIRWRKKLASLPSGVTDRTTCQLGAILNSMPSLRSEQDRPEDIPTHPKSEQDRSSKLSRPSKPEERKIPTIVLYTTIYRLPR